MNYRIFKLLSLCFISQIGVHSLYANTQEIKKILLLIHSRTGNTLTAAQKIQEGLEKNHTIVAEIKSVPFLSTPPSSHEVEGLPEATLDELESYDAIIFGSPVYFHSPSAEILAFLQAGMRLWENKALKDKLAGVFLSSNGNGVNSAEYTLKSILQALYMDTDTLQNLCPLADSQDQNNLYLYGTCIAESLDIQKRNFKNIVLPPPPQPVGLYQTFIIAGKLIYINQIALKNNEIEYPGVIGEDLDEAQAKLSTQQAMLNVLSVLNEAVGADLSRIKQAVQISGFFNTQAGYTRHSQLLDEASLITAEFLGANKGKHTRGAFGVLSLPKNSPVEIQAIFELY